MSSSRNSLSRGYRLLKRMQASTAFRKYPSSTLANNGQIYFKRSTSVITIRGPSCRWTRRQTVTVRYEHCLRISSRTFLFNVFDLRPFTYQWIFGLYLRQFNAFGRRVNHIDDFDSESRIWGLGETSDSCWMINLLEV